MTPGRSAAGGRGVGAEGGVRVDPPEDVAATEPSVGDDDFNTLIDLFVVQTMLTSDSFRAQLCRAFERALTVQDVEEFLVQILEWVRDQVGARPDGRRRRGGKPAASARRRG